jgi:hypothetical protein
LLRTLGGLVVRVEEVRCRYRVVEVEDYPGGRPTSVVELAGARQAGFGELVSFTVDEHVRFAQRLSEWVSPRQGRLEDLVPAGAGPHASAAIEAALIDLGLRQAGMSLGELGGMDEGRVRWVVSLAAMEDPRLRLAQLRARDPGVELKLDVHADWSAEVIASLKAEHQVAIFDFKDAGAAALAERLSAAFPEVIFEDPPAGCTHARIARDRPLAGLQEVAAVLARGELVNLKAPRMGGFLPVLRALERLGEGSSSGPTAAYFGGMFEVGPGREQARQMAALFCPLAPNDLAPLEGGTSSMEGPSPSRLHLDRPGFGSIVG